MERSYFTEEDAKAKIGERTRTLVAWSGVPKSTDGCRSPCRSCRHGSPDLAPDGKTLLITEQGQGAPTDYGIYLRRTDTLRRLPTCPARPGIRLLALAAAAQLQVPIRLVSCLGFGAELREGVRHAQVLQRVAELSRIGGYLGVAALLADTPPGDAYRKALDFTFANQASQRTSHVHTMVLAAMRGDFGAAGPDVWVSPLSSLLWFFDLTVVARSHLFLDHLLETETVFGVTSVVRGCRRNLEVKPPSDIPL